MAVVNTGMSKGDMKKLLVHSKEEPVGCAIGTGDNAAYGLMLLSKMRSGVALEKTLKSEFSDAKNTRFGSAFVDVDDNPKLVKLRINRAVSGVAKKLVKTLKGTGFNKVVIVTDDGVACDSHEEDDDEAETVAPAAEPATAEVPSAEAVTAVAVDAATVQAALATAAPLLKQAIGADPASRGALEAAAADVVALLRGGDTAGAQRAADRMLDLIEMAQGAPDAQPPAEAAQVQAGFAALVPQVKAAAGSASYGAMTASAAALVGHLKAGDAEAARHDLTQLASLLDTDRRSVEAPRQPYMAMMLDWETTRKAVDADLGTLEQAILDAFSDTDDFSIARSAVRKLDTVLGQFTEDLQVRLDALAAAADPIEPRRAALALVTAHRTAVEGDALIAALDDNPFAPVAVHKALSATLGRLAAQLGG